jgi:flavin reductase (DIM6/NTAB) family NADH-FMN oxidoreductase RutF
VSLEPPLVLICLAHSVASIEAFRTASHFGLSILSSAQIDTSDRFARFADDRFEGIPWHPAPHGSPLLDGAVANIECSLARWFPLGDHDVFVGEVLFAEVLPGDPLVFFGGDYRRLG